MGPVSKTIIGGVTVVVLVYVLLAHSHNLGTELGTATKGYADFAKTARGE